MRKTLTLIFSASCRFYQSFLFCYPCWCCSLLWISSFTLCVTVRITINYQLQNTCFTWSRKIKWCKPQVLQFNNFSVSSPLIAFPGLITIVDCQRTYLVAFLPDLLLSASNLIGSETLSARACSPPSSSPPDAGESSESIDHWSNATRRCSSRYSSNRSCFHLLLIELSRWYT